MMQRANRKSIKNDVGLLKTGRKEMDLKLYGIWNKEATTNIIVGKCNPDIVLFDEPYIKSLAVSSRELEKLNMPSKSNRNSLK